MMFDVCGQEVGARGEEGSSFGILGRQHFNDVEFRLRYSKKYWFRKRKR